MTDETTTIVTTEPTTTEPTTTEPTVTAPTPLELVETAEKLRGALAFAVTGYETAEAALLAQIAIRDDAKADRKARSKAAAAIFDLEDAFAEAEERVIAAKAEYETAAKAALAPLEELLVKSLQTAKETRDAALTSTTETPDRDALFDRAVTEFSNLLLAQRDVNDARRAAGLEVKTPTSGRRNGGGGGATTERRPGGILWGNAEGGLHHKVGSEAWQQLAPIFAAAGVTPKGAAKPVKWGSRADSRFLDIDKGDVGKLVEGLERAITQMGDDHLDTDNGSEKTRAFRILLNRVRRFEQGEATELAK